MSGIFDRILQKCVSRKLFVLLLGTVFCMANLLGEDNWLTLAMMYVGTQGAVDAVASFGAGSRGENDGDHLS